ncbi:hypothetical protein BDA99DRAFT_518130 [Phascolomyces articulosus]|uniref:Uncharacterized protein n=1 Tax=Phascolomyces articulosus TaxID=60185 RepID=A0AAD5K5C2_9FUNG|nr:hypothetical protein BDA99DRAFT_518130 [Phascolomyces articulosus]
MYRPPPPNAPGFQGTPPPPASSWQRPPPPGIMGGGDPMMPPPPAVLWKEHKNAEGRKYWFNTMTRKSTWEKPEELLTPEEKDLMNCPWKEYKTPEGKTYYSHAETKESKWSMPDEYKELYEKAEKAKERAAKEAQRPTPPPPPQLPIRPPVPVPMPMSVSGPPPTGIVPPISVSGPNAIPMNAPSDMTAPNVPSPHKMRPDMTATTDTANTTEPPTTTGITTPAAITTSTRSHHHKIRQPPPSAALLSQVPVVEFPTKEEAEKAFYKLLKETGVKLDWTWDQTMREIITHPIYRALKTPGERKAAFHAYLDKEAKRERELREEKESKQRMSFFHMLENTKEIKPYSRYRTLIKSISHQPAYLQVKSESQREQYFEEYVHGLQRREKDRLRELRKTNMEHFSHLLRKIPEITYETKWKEAQQLYMEHPDFKEHDKAFEGMDMLDFLSVYEEHSRTLWEVPLAELNNKLRERRRSERKAREGFRKLLAELTHRGIITARSLWKEVYPEIKDDSRYTNLLGVPESTPFNLFCDLLDVLDERLYQDKRLIYDILKEFDFEVSLETTFEDYQELLKRRPDLIERASQSNVKIIFDHLQNKAAQRLKDEKRRQEKKMKKKIDALRHAMKYLEPTITVDDTWETVQPRIEHLPEYQTIEDEQQRMEAYEKYIKRLKEKQHNADHNDEDEEEGMIKEDEDYSKHHPSSSRRYKQRRGSDRESDHGYSDEERSRKRKKRRHTSSHHDNFDQPVDGNRSSAEEGEALDDYENDPRRSMH